MEIQSPESGVPIQERDTNAENGLKRLVFKLEPIYKDVINLLYFFGHTQQETSEILNLPLGTVKTKTRKALQLLRQHCAHE